MSKSIITFEPWIGEFGWEVMNWQSQCRKMSRSFNLSIACSFPGMAPLYKDFASEFLAHDRPNRSLGFPHKRYRVDGEWIQFGNPVKNPPVDVLCHGRGISKCSFKNWAGWANLGCTCGWIGTKQDLCFGAYDYRGMDLQSLMDLIASVKVVVGGSSGVMHLAALCKTPLVVWGDNRTYFNETLEKRYKETWNPLDTQIEWVETSNWNPKVEDVENGIRKYTG